MSNPFKNWDAFNIGVNCPKDQQKRVKRNSTLFLVFILIGITSIGLMVPIFLVGSETTLIFRNSDSVVGFRVGKILSSSDYPQQPLKVDDENGSSYSITAINISSAFVKAIGFMVIDSAFMSIIAQTPQLYTELIGYSMLKLYPLLRVGTTDNLTILSQLDIYPYLQQYPVLLVMGNFEEDITHDVIFKVSRGKYFIPLFQIEFVTTSPTKHLYAVGGWVDFSNLDVLKTKFGVWEVAITTISYNYATSVIFAEDRLQNIGETDLPPITITGTVTQSTEFWKIFTPATQYSTIPS